MLMLVKEVAKSKDETIRAKEQMIQFLESMISRRSVLVQRIRPLNGMYQFIFMK